jgi:hypothetical protein
MLSGFIVHQSKRGQDDRNELRKEFKISDESDGRSCASPQLCAFIFQTICIQQITNASEGSPSCGISRFFGQTIKL